MINMTESQECIAQTIYDLLDEHQDFTPKQIVGKAYSKCGAHSEDFKSSGFCPYHLLAKTKFSKAFLNKLSTDFIQIPKSVMISKAVDSALPILKKNTWWFLTVLLNPGAASALSTTWDILG